MTDQQPRTVATPGHLLRAARRRYGWSVEDIAEELNRMEIPLPRLLDLDGEEMI